MEAKALDVFVVDDKLVLGTKENEAAVGAYACLNEKGLGEMKQQLTEGVEILNGLLEELNRALD